MSAWPCVAILSGWRVAAQAQICMTQNICVMTTLGERHPAESPSTALPLLCTNHMLSRAAIVCVGMIIFAGAGRVSAQAVIPDADRYIKIGTRIPEVAPGEGGELRVVADRQWCGDASHVLEVRALSRTGTMPVVRLHAGPTNCEWVFGRMPVGQYEALILTTGDERIVASGLNTLSRGATALIVIESAVAEIEGRVTSQQPLPSPLRLKFVLPDGKSWNAPVAADGSYHVKLSTVSERATLAIWAEADEPHESERTSTLNLFLLKTIPITRGLLQLDLDDLKLPPVVVHVEVPPVADAGFAEFAEAMLDNQRGPGFKLINGLRGQFLATYGQHTINIWTNDRQHVLATTVVNVNTSDTEVRVVLQVPRR
jgi:hypothetical protein